MKVKDLPAGSWMLLGETYAYEHPYSWVDKRTGEVHHGSKGWGGHEKNDVLIWDGLHLFFLFRNRPDRFGNRSHKGAGEVGGGGNCPVAWDESCGCWRMG